jgi:chromosome segregation ATPase
MEMGEDTTQEFPKNSLAVILARFESMEGSFRSEMGSFDLRLTALDEKVDRRLLETRPIWELVLSRLDSVDVRLESLDSRVGSLHTKIAALDTRVGSVESKIGFLVKGFDRIEEEFENMGLKFRTFQNDLLRMQTRHEKLTERLERIESPPAV